MSLALYGSFLPIPSNDLFELEDSSHYARSAAPGAVVVRRELILLNQGRDRIRLRVTNKGDRPIQVCWICRTNSIYDIDSSTGRLGRITTLLRRILRSNLIVGKRMESVSIFLRVQRYDSNQEIARV